MNLSLPLRRQGSSCDGRCELGRRPRPARNRAEPACVAYCCAPPVISLIFCVSSGLYGLPSDRKMS